MKHTIAYIRRKVARRLFGLFVASALIPVCALAAIALRQVSDSSRKQSTDLLRRTSENVGMTIHEFLYMLHTEMDSIALTVKNGGLPSPTGHEDLPGVGRNKRIVALSLFPRRGGRIAIYGADCPPPRLTAATRKHIAEGKLLFYRQEGPNGTLRLFSAIALDKGDPARGLLVGEINSDYLWEIVGYTLPPATDVCILDHDGRLLYTSSATQAGFIPQVVQRLKHSSVGHFQWGQGAEGRLVGYWSVFLKYRFDAPPLAVVVSQSTGDAFASMDGFTRTFSLIAVLTLLVVIFISSIQIRRSLVPLAILKDAAQRISRGDFDHQIEIASADEFEHLAEAFNDMSAHLKKQFRTQSGMGQIVRKILAGQNRETIVATVMSDMNTVISSPWYSISLTMPAVADMALSYYAGGADGFTPGEDPLVTTFTVEESALLQNARDSLHVTPDPTTFTALLAPLRAEGAKECFLVPIILNGALSGTLALGYLQAPEQVRDDLMRARQIADQIAVALENVQLIEEMNQLNLGTIRALANAVDAKSPWTAGHSWRVTTVAMNIGRHMGLPEERLKVLYKGGLFHDIGKIGVPEEILDKPGNLSDEEYASIKRHPEIGAEILRPIQAYEELIPIVLQHHEWFDGGGYPYGMTGEAISLEARILAVADVYDALITDRPYRQGWSYESVIAYLVDNSGSQFDPSVVRAVLEINDRRALERSSVTYQHAA